MKVCKLLTTLLLIIATPAYAASPRAAAISSIQTTAQNQIHRLVDPLLEHYCHDACKLLGISVNVDLETPDNLAPGFDDVPTVDSSDLAPTSATIKLLIDERLGPVSRGKLLDLIQQYLDTLDYPVKIASQVTHFPQPVGSDSKIPELRERVSRSFQNTINDLIQQFCPDRCMMADFNLRTEPVNLEETQYGAPNKFVQEDGVALRINEISATILMDESLSPEERANIIEMMRLKTASFADVTLNAKAMKFPHPLGMAGDGSYYDAAGNLVRGSNHETNSKTDSKSQESRQLSSTQTNENRQASDSRFNEQKNSSEKDQTTSNQTEQKQERYEKFEKIERVENGDAVQAELRKFQIYALIFGCSVLSLLIFIALSSWKGRRASAAPEVIMAAPPAFTPAPEPTRTSVVDPETEATRATQIAVNTGGRFEAARLQDELISVFAQQPQVAKYVFSRILVEDGVEVTSQYVHIFGESIVFEMLRDPSLQGDLNELIEFYSRSAVQLSEPERLDLLRKLHQKTVAGKIAVMGKRSSTIFDFLAEMDASQIFEMVKGESLTVKSIVLTQCDAQKRSAIYARFDEDSRLRLLNELSRIDYLPRDYIFNVANALKRKRREDPRLNTEPLPGSEVLVSLLERTGKGVQRDVVKSLELNNPDSARTVKSKLISIETLRFLRDGQLLEVVLSLRHDELLQFLKSAPTEITATILEKAPHELRAELREELETVGPVHRENYIAIERKILNRMKLMANDGLINLIETNDRMFADMTMHQGGTVAGTIGPSGRAA